MTNYGRTASQSHPFFGFIAPGDMRACVFNKTTENGWVYQLGIYAGKYTLESSSNVTTRLALYDTDSSKDPDDRQGYTDSFSVTSSMPDATGGTSYTADIAVSVGPSNDSIPIYSGRRYAIAALGTVGWLAHGMQEAAQISADNESFYNRSGLSQPPPSNFGSFTSSNEGHMTIWAVYEANVAPSTPTSLSPSGSINDTVPTFSADFADSNSDHGDYLNQFRVQVRRVSDLTSFWDTTLTANSSERTAEAFSRTYGGTTLVRGTAYEWRTQMSDHFGSWSAWTSWTTFTPANLGFVTLDSDPTGKIEDNTPDFKGRWTHQSSTTMKTCMVRVLNASGSTVLQTGSDYNIADVSSSASPGTLFTIPWANTGLSDLAWGTSYRYQIRGYDGTQWSDWSASRTFNTNAAPSVPSDLSPGGSLPLTDYPLLSCVCTDADDTTASGFAVSCRIKDNSGSVLFTRSMTYNTGNSRWEYQTDGTDLASFATYRWDAYGYDGTLYSGEQTVEANAIKSAEAVFIYADGPTVTIDTPSSGTVTTASLLVEWTTVDQTKYRVYLYDSTGTDLVYDSGVVVDVMGTHTIPSGYYHNGLSYQLIVWVEDLTPLTGQSAPMTLTIDYVEPDAVANFQATAVPIGNDPNGWTTANRLTWDATTYGTDVWQRYEIQRQAASGVDSQLVLWRNDLTGPTQITVTDYTPANGIEYTYTIRQITKSGLDELESVAVSASATASFGGVVLCDVSAPDVLRSALRYTDERPHKFDKDATKYTPLSGATATTVRSRYRNWESDFKFQLHTDEWSTAVADRAQLLALDANMGTICYRNNLGDKHFCTMPKCEPTDQIPEWFDGRIQLEEELFAEGVTS